MHRPIVFLAVFAYLLIGMRGAEAVVLCFGTDGHVAFEATVSGTPWGRHGTPLERDAVVKNNHDDSCVDFPILVSGSSPKLTQTKANAKSSAGGPLGPMLVAVREPFPVPAARPAVTPVSPPGANTTLRFLRTVSLNL